MQFEDENGAVTSLFTLEVYKEIHDQLTKVFAKFISCLVVLLSGILMD